MNIHPVRLNPGEDLRKELMDYVYRHQLSSAWILTGMGSLSVLSIRFAGARESTFLSRDWEICVLSGTLCIDGPHLHIVASDSQGRCVGGHLGVGSIIRTTAEIVMGSRDDIRFRRVYDEQTGYPELMITNPKTRE